MKNNLIKKNKGFSLIEVLIASAIISLCLFALVSAASEGYRLSKNTLRQNQANMLLEEGAEAVKSIRDIAWTNISSLTMGATYYLTFDTNSNTWTLGNSPISPIDAIFTRTIVFSNVERSASDDIVSSAGSWDDPGTKKVTITVTWVSYSGRTSSKTLSFYMSDIFS